MEKILIVEDEKSISIVLRAYLKKAGYEVEQAYEGNHAMTLFKQWKPSLVILDVMLPGIDGWTILRAIREQSACPVIMLTALSNVQNKVDGLSSGADDYISKPFVGEEVVARVQAVLRRPAQVRTEEAVVFGTLKIDYAAHEVFLKGKPVYLSPRELSLLMFLAKHANQVFDREQLIANVWGIDYEGSDRAVDLSIKRIRQALAEWPSEEGSLVTLTKVGYQLRVPT